jgi:YesN/AraC family two-component response regulator
MEGEKNYKILLVDDSVSYLKAFKMQLNDVFGNNIVYIDNAINGIEAIEMVKSKPFDIIFMDIDMPGLNGIETTKYLKKFFPSIYVIGLSMHEQFYFKDKMLLAGSDLFVTKDNLDEESLIEIFSNYDKKALK